VMADVQNWQASRSLGPRGVELKKSGDWLACQIKQSQHNVHFHFCTSEVVY
jgi:hypothetical protein